MQYTNSKLPVYINYIILVLIFLFFFGCQKKIESHNSGNFDKISKPKVENSIDSLTITEYINCGVISNEGCFDYDENGKIHYQYGTSRYIPEGKNVYLYEDGVNVGTLECEGGVEEEIKTVNWGDGNNYEYHYTEIINVEDTNGEIVPIKVYVNNEPVNSDCNTKKCKWCNSIINLRNSYTEEYPNLDNLRENPNRESIANLLLSFGIISSSLSNYVYTNNSKDMSIRTVRNTICEYDEFQGFCSRKCYYDAKNK